MSESSFKASKGATITIKVTKSEWLEISRWDDEGGRHVDVVYEIINEAKEINDNLRFEEKSL